MTTPTQSYFLKLVAQENTTRTSYTRNNDEKIVQMQFPVGWTLFSRTNVDALVKELAIKVPNIDFQYLCPIMQWAYETRGRVLESMNKSTLASSVKTLNELVKKRVLTNVAGDVHSRRQAVNVFYGRDMRSFNLPHYEASSRVNNTRSHTFTSQPDPAADPGNLFGDV